MPFRSTLPDLAIPDDDFSAFVLARGRLTPGKTALIDVETGARISYGELIAAIERAAERLLAHGLRPGDMVAICGFNTPSFAVAAHAVWRAGGVVVTMNPLFTVREMHQELADAGARFVVAASEVTEKVAEAARLAGVAEVLSLGEPDSLSAFDDLKAVDGDVGAMNAGAMNRAPTGSGDVGARFIAPDSAVAPDDVALVLYSSGTTGLAKGVMLTQRNLKAALLQLYAGDLARQDDVLVAISPFFHVVGLHGILNLGLFAGATIATIVRFEMRKFLGAVQEHRISSAFLTPPVVNDLIRNPAVDAYDVSSLRSILCAAAPLGPEAEAAAASRLGCVVRQGFGMTEATGPISTMLIGDEQGRRGSVGTLAPSTECKIVDLETGREVGPGEHGEVLVRGPQVMLGYLNQPEATAITVEPDGWLHTGDVGYADADGFLYIVDRVKEIIKYKAYQVAPAELEAVIGTHPFVMDAAVVPSPDAESGEIPKAFVVLQSGVPADAATTEAILAYVAERVAPYKKVRAIEVVDAIPKSPSGKILRRVLVERERVRTARG
jgi:acyl-CoA synthetase (AMP-forming)/AMP-acid ligase II